MLWQHKHVCYPRERRIVSHNSRESHLIIAFVNAEGKRVLDRSFDDFARAARGPVRMVREKVVNQIDIEAIAIAANQIVAALPRFRFMSTVHVTSAAANIGNLKVEL